MGECAPAAAAPTTAKTSVWWDIDKYAVPRGRCDPHRIAHNLIAALAAAGYAGPVSIAAYGDAARVPPPVLAALSATGICLNHVPTGTYSLPSCSLHWPNQIAWVIGFAVLIMFFSRTDDCQGARTQVRRECLLTCCSGHSTILHREITCLSQAIRISLISFTGLG